VSQRFDPSHQDPFLAVSERVALSLRAMGAVGQAWLAGLPGLLAGLANDWSITIGARLDGGRASYVAVATTHDGTPAVLKVSIPPGNDELARLFLMVGLPGAGKTTRARELAAAHRALRLTPDEWMVSLFGDSNADGKRDVLEGLLIAVAVQALRLGTSVVLDFGLWSRDERSALRWLAASAGATCQVIYLPVDKEVQRARIAHRQATEPHTTFPMTDADIDRWRTQFQVPDAAELDDGPTVPGPPPGWSGWPDWAADRWPSLDPVRLSTPDAVTEPGSGPASTAPA
jgi:predicted kinase